MAEIHNCKAHGEFKADANDSPCPTCEDQTEPMTYQDVVDNLSETLTELGGEDIVEIYNNICMEKIEYIGDNLWQKSS